MNLQQGIPMPLLIGIGLVIVILIVRALLANRQDDSEEMIAVAAAAAYVSEVPAVQNGISSEVLAAIAAAVYATTGQSASSIRSITRAAGARSIWAQAGRLESTRPF